MSFTKNLKDVGRDDVRVAGGKGANLGELIRLGILVPEGFVITAQTFENLIGRGVVREKMANIMNNLDPNDAESLFSDSQDLKSLILEQDLPEGLTDELTSKFQSLGTDLVAVRSSATAEDSMTDSWAGELETYLNVDRDGLIDSVKSSWASLFTPRAILYCLRRDLEGVPVFVSVIVQKMIQSDVSGVCFTVHPVTNNDDQVVIEAVWGLGELLVSGQVTPDTYVLDKGSLGIIDQSINFQESMIALSEKKGVGPISVSGDKTDQKKLSDKNLKKIAKVCLQIENHYQYPQDIEFALVGNKIYILQARPVTTLG